MVLQSVKVSHLSIILNRFYESPKLKNWMCELCTFFQIRSHIIKVCLSCTYDCIDLVKLSNSSLSHSSPTDSKTPLEINDLRCGMHNIDKMCRRVVNNSLKNWTIIKLFRVHFVIPQNCTFLLSDIAEFQTLVDYPVKMLSRRILWDLAGFCRNLAGFLHEILARFLQNPTRSRRILQDLARSCRGARKKDLFLQELARAFLLGMFKAVTTVDMIVLF